MEQENDNVHDIFKLNSNLNMHTAISNAAEQMQKRAESESDWVADLAKEKETFSHRMTVLISQHKHPMTRMEAHLTAFNVQGDALEAKHKYVSQWNMYRKAIAEKRKPLIEKYSNSAKRYTGKQIDELIEGDLAELMHTAKVLEDHIEFMDKVQSEMINITFSMKYFQAFDDYMKK